jgi:hypothetical protein
MATTQDKPTNSDLFNFLDSTIKREEEMRDKLKPEQKDKAEAYDAAAKATEEPKADPSDPFAGLKPHELPKEEIYRRLREESKKPGGVDLTEAAKRYRLPVLNAHEIFGN